MEVTSLQTSEVGSILELKMRTFQRKKEVREKKLAAIVFREEIFYWVVETLLMALFYS